MSGYKEGRLRRMFRHIGYPTGLMFAFYSDPTGAIYDQNIQSVTIHRGKSERGGGSHPSTMEIKFKGRHDQKLGGNNCRFFLRSDTVAALANFLGTDQAGLDLRFTGRMGAVDIEDRGTRFSTTVSAASWIAQLNRSTTWTTPTAGQSLQTVLTNLMDASNPLRGITVDFLGTYDSIATTQDPVAFKDGVGKYAGDIGILLRETRGGTTQVLPLPWRITDAEQAVASTLPLTRSQAISPAEWKQGNEWPAARVVHTYTQSDGSAGWYQAVYGPTTGVLRETEEHDWSYIKVNGAHSGSQLFREAWGRCLASAPDWFTVPTITVDLLHLITSGKQYHRDQAAQLLRLEAGDPVYFSGDWPAALQGVHFAEGITETITGDRWDLELSLVPFQHAMGKQTVPPVPARVWDSAGNTWDNETRTWSQA